MTGIRSIAAVTILASALVACGGGGSGSGSGSSGSGGTVSIDGFSVTGTSATSSGSVPPINPGVNGGQFVLSWSASPDTYNASFYLSPDNSLATTSGDVQIASINCGLVVSRCDRNGTLACTFDNNNTVLCDLAQKRNIATLLDTIPKRLFLINKTCNALFTVCDTKALEIEFQ